MDVLPFQIVFGTIAVVGWLALLLPLIMGMGLEIFDGPIDAVLEVLEIDILPIPEAADTRALGVIIFFFLAVFGTSVWVPVTLGWLPPLTAIVVGVLLAYFLAYLVRKLILFLLREEKAMSILEDKIGQVVILTSTLEPGDIGEAFLGADKVSVKLEGLISHHRDDELIITGIENHRFLVRAKRTTTSDI